MISKRDTVARLVADWTAELGAPSSRSVKSIVHDASLSLSPLVASQGYDRVFLRLKTRVGKLLSQRGTLRFLSEPERNLARGYLKPRPVPSPRRPLKPGREPADADLSHALAEVRRNVAKLTHPV